MGLLAALRPGTGIAELTAAAALIPTGVITPWGSDRSHLESIVLADVFGADVPEVLSRARAIRIPAVARARGVICTTIARIELGDYRGDTRLTAGDAAAWLAATDGALSPLHRMLWTVDDLYFYGWSCWLVTARGVDNFPLRMDRVPIGQWQLEDGTGRVLIYKPDPVTGVVRLQPAAAREVVLIPGPHEGVLSEGAPALRHAADLQRSAHTAAKHPSAYLGLKQTSGPPLKRRSADPAEVTVETILADWRHARLNPEGGGVAWLGGVEAVELGSFAEHLVTAGRNAADVDVARHSYIPADLIDASVPESSLHYSTSRDNDRRAIDYGLGAYMACITARLSQDDVHPRGRRIAFDLEQWLRGAAPVPGQAPTEPTPGLTPDGQETPA